MNKTLLYNTSAGVEVIRLDKKSIFARLKLGLAVSWLLAVLGNYKPDVLILASPLLFGVSVALIFPIAKYIWTPRTILVALFFSTSCMGALAIFQPESKPMYAAWQIILLALLYLSGSIRNVGWYPLSDGKKLKRQFHIFASFANIICASVLLLSIISSFQFFSTGRGLLNPNVAVAICGALFIAFYVENKIVPKASIKILFWIAIIAAILQLSRSLIFWLLALYFIGGCVRGEKYSFLVLAMRLTFLSLILFIVLLIALPDLINPSAIEAVILELPAMFRLKEGGLESDVLRVLYYPQILVNSISDYPQLFFGSGIGTKPYLAELQAGEDLHNAFLIIVSDGGLLLLIATVLLMLRRGNVNLPVYGAKVTIFLSGAVFSGIMMGLAPFTLVIITLLSFVASISPRVHK
jgi:hypothetical protein